MGKATQKVLRHAVYRLLRPLSRVLMQHGMAWGSFMELARKAWVDEAYRQVAARGKRPTISAVSALTGLTRKETKRIRDEVIDDDGERDLRYNRAIRVVSGWTGDDRFQDSDGNPAALPIEGENSFATLVKDYSGDIPTVAMLAILETSNTVAVADGRVRLLERAYIPADTPAEHLALLGADTGEFVATIGHNFASPREARVYQRKVSNPNVDAASLQEFRHFSNAQSQALLERYHHWLTEHEVDPADADAVARYVAVGVYYYDDSLDGESPP